MKIYLLLPFITAFLYFNIAKAQDQIIKCYTDEMFQKQIIDDPSALKNRLKLDEFVKNYIKEGKDKEQVLIIPVVFHVIHNYGPENISKKQIIDQMRILNEDYRKTTSDTSKVVDVFKPLYADIEVEFRLAQIDPDGNCTEGIVRYVSESTYDAYNNIKYEFPPWPRDKYVNIWVVHDIHNDGGGTILGYAQFPGGSASTDGIVLWHQSVGSIGASSTDGRTLPHELGHYFGLCHPWGCYTSCGDSGNCSNDDNIEDTPNTIGNCSTCDLERNSCNDGLGDMIDNVQNAMDYSTCGFMFTSGQKDVMRAVLNASTSDRNKLWTTENLIATGTNDGYIASPCKPIADFYSDQVQVCEGSNINFFDLSYNADINSWLWTFEGGEPGTSIDSSVSVYYENPGRYSVNLIATTSSGSDTITKSDFIYIIDTYAGYGLPMFEDFEDNTFPLNSEDETKNWTIISESAGSWEFSTLAAADGSGSVIIKNKLIADQTKNSLISPNINLREITPESISFNLAYAHVNSSSNNELKVYLSKNCGLNWQLIYAKSGNQLVTNGGEYVSDDFIPEADEWRMETISNSTFVTQDKIMLKFENISAGGNNLFIDNISIDQLVAIENMQKQVLKFEVYPNPYHSDANIVYKIQKPGNVYIEIIDVFGKSCGQFNSLQKPGVYTLALSQISNNLQSGTYLIRIISEGNLKSKRIIKLN